MTLTRQMTFWVLTFLAVIVSLWVLREILLPFVAGMALAYLLDPLTTRLERLGVRRFIGALVLIGVVVFAFIFLILTIAPILGGQLTQFVENIPGYISRLQALVSESNREWLRGIVGDGIAEAQI